MDSSDTSLARAGLSRSQRLLMIVWLLFVLAPLATVDVRDLTHALLYLTPVLVFLVPLCLNRDPAGRLLVRLARPARRKRAIDAHTAGGRLHAAVRHAVVWTPGGGLLIGMGRAGRAPPRTPLPAVLALRH